MAIDYSKFDKAVDLDGLKNDVKSAEENNQEYAEVPHGQYEVKVGKMELTESKKGDPMVSIWFKILAGEHKGQNIFMNQVVTKGFQIHIVDEILRAMDTDIAIQFESYSQYAKLLADVYEAVDGKLEFGLDYGENKGFNTFKITDVFDAEA